MYHDTYAQIKARLAAHKIKHQSGTWVFFHLIVLSMRLEIESRIARNCDSICNYHARTTVSCSCFYNNLKNNPTIRFKVAKSSKHLIKSCVYESMSYFIGVKKMLRSPYVI